jgi:hypothetical protein
MTVNEISVLFKALISLSYRAKQNTGRSLLNRPGRVSGRAEQLG